MATPIGPEAQRPNPTLARLAPLIGRWRTTGTHPLMPGTTFHGRTSFEWHEAGAFVEMRTEIEEPEIPSAVAIIGSDDSAGTLTMLYFDERDISRRVRGRGDRPRGELAPRRGRVRPAHGPHHRRGRHPTRHRGTMSHDGGAWEDDLQLTFERITH